MIRLLVFSRSDEFHRNVRRSLQKWGIVQLALAARSVREITSRIGSDVIVLHDAEREEIDSIGDTIGDKPLVLVGAANGLITDHDEITVVLGPGSENEPDRVIAAAVAAAHGLVVQDGTEAPDYARLGAAIPLTHDGFELTPREIEVLRLISAGHPNREIARALGITENTVKYHLSGLFAKLGVANRTEATFEGIRRGIVTL